MLLLVVISNHLVRWWGCPDSGVPEFMAQVLISVELDRLVVHLVPAGPDWQSEGHILYP